MTPPTEDDWHGIDDRKKRKQIQDRLAQRARRRRLALALAEKSHPSSPRLVNTHPPNSTQSLVSLKPDQSQASEAIYFASSSYCNRNPEPLISPDHAHLTLPLYTVYSALYHNGIILGIPCVTSAIQRSLPAAPHVPAPLRPTRVQLEEVHYSFIDRLPEKQLRQNMIALSESFSAEDFLADVFSTPSFFVEPGGKSWETEAWSVDAGFWGKWGFLFEGVELRIRE